MSGASVTPDELAARVGKIVGTSRWFCVDQALIDAFADATGDRQFIHVDPERAARETPFDGTVAHGFLTVSMLSAMAEDALPVLANRTIGMNYGFDRLRFLSPVPAGSRIRAHFTLVEVKKRSARELQTTYDVVVELGGAAKPALAARWITLAIAAAS